MTTGLAQRPTEADAARYHVLKSIIRRNHEEALEWLKAVQEVRETAMWMQDCDTWDAFCQKNMGMDARQVRDKVGNLTTKPVAALPKLPPPSKSDMGQIVRHAEGLGRRFGSFVKNYVKLTDDWPDLPADKLAEFDARLAHFSGDFELFLAENGCISEACRKIDVRIRGRKKGKKK